jgi:hypothetical protein
VNREGALSLTKALGTGLEHVGEEALDLGSPWLSLGGLAAGAVATYGAYINTLIESHELQRQGGELDGTYYTLRTANNLDTTGQLADISEERFIVEVLKVRQIERKNVDVTREEALDRARGTLGRWAIIGGREEGVRKAVHHLQAAMAQAKERYEDVRTEMSTPPVFNLERHAWASRRQAYAKAGLTFVHPNEEVRLLQHIVFKKIWEQTYPEILRAREEIPERPHK